MLTTFLDVLGLCAMVAAALLGAVILFGVVGLVVTLGAVAAVALGSSWLIDRLRA